MKRHFPFGPGAWRGPGHAPAWRRALKRHAFAGVAWSALLALLATGACKRNAASPVTVEDSKYDAGPRAIEDPLDPELAAAGARLFASKACITCHVQGVGFNPDLVGVSTRRTTEWLEQFMLHPEIMVREDLIGRELIHEFTIQMPNFDLTPREARMLVEYFKLQDRGRAPSLISAR